MPITTSSKGFTLVEVVVAVFVVSLGVLGVFSLIQNVAASTSISVFRFTATYLTQEGIEIVRNIRDSNWLGQRTNPAIKWDDAIPDGSWQADYETQSLAQPYNGAYLNVGSSGFYGYSMGSPSKFRRKITIQKLDIKPTGGDGEYDVIKVLVETFWDERGRTHKVQAQEDLYNWY